MSTNGEKHAGRGNYALKGPGLFNANLFGDDIGESAVVVFAQVMILSTF